MSGHCIIVEEWNAVQEGGRGRGSLCERNGGVWCGGRDRGKEALNGCSWVESVRIYRDEFIEPQVKEVREGGGGVNGVEWELSEWEQLDLISL